VGFALLVGGGLAAAIFAERPGLAVWGAIRWGLVAVLVFGGFSLLDNPDTRSRAADVVSTSAIVVAGFGALQLAGFYAFVQEPFLADRIDSTFGFYTQFAAFMAIAAVIATNEAVVALDRANHQRALLHISAASAGCLGVGVSLSRGGFLALVVGFLWLITVNTTHLRRLLRIAAVLLAVASLGFLITPSASRSTLLQRVQDPSLSRGSDNERRALQASGTRALRSLPVGIGYGNFPRYLRRTGLPSGIDTTFFHAHRLPVQVGLDAGWVGLAGFLILSLLPLGRSIENLLRGTPDVHGAGFTAALVGFLAQGWYDYLFYETSFVVLFGLLVWGAWPHRESQPLASA
jgi:hypothetical protein